jgi:hypothetical protein
MDAVLPRKPKELWDMGQNCDGATLDEMIRKGPSEDNI